MFNEAELVLGRIGMYKQRIKGYRLLVSDQDDTYQFSKFEEYCKTNKIIIYCILPHDLYKAQPCGVSMFLTPRKVYGIEFSNLMQVGEIFVTLLKSNSLSLYKIFISRSPPLGKPKVLSKETVLSSLILVNS